MRTLVVIIVPFDLEPRRAMQQALDRLEGALAKQQPHMLTGSQAVFVCSHV